ncbi:MAG: NUDIX domain-containing protein [archaeon]|jgi:hypothetical protein
MRTKILPEIDNVEITTENLDNTNISSEKSVEVYILNENKEFIIVFSGPKDEFCKVLTGNLKEKETFEEAAIRQAKEKLGIDVQIISVSKHTYESDIGKGKSIIAKLNPPHQHLKMQTEEISGYKWIRKEKIYQYIGKLDQLVQAEKIFKEFREYF